MSFTSQNLLTDLSFLGQWDAQCYWALKFKLLPRECMKSCGKEMSSLYIHSFFSFLCVGVWHASMCASVWTPIVFLSYSPSCSLSSSIQLIHSKDPISGFQAGVNSRQAAVPTLLQGCGLWSSWHYKKHFEHRIISLAPISFVLEHLNRTCVSLTIFNVF